MKSRFIGIIALIAALASCSGNYQIEGSYPTPLIPSLPVQLELELDEAFSSYTYVDERQGGYDVTIALGEAQTQLFETITQAMFSTEEGAPVLKMKPSVDAFQYSVPRETRSEIYEVWIKYRISIEEPDGREIADWIITGYGKTPTAMLKRQGEAINAASIIALRDIGTQLAIGFKRQADISLWLSSNLETYQP